MQNAETATNTLELTSAMAIKFVMTVDNCPGKDPNGRRRSAHSCPPLGTQDLREGGGATSSSSSAVMVAIARPLFAELFKGYLRLPLTSKANKD